MFFLMNDRKPVVRSLTQPYLDECLQLIRGHTRVSVKERSLLQGDARLLHALEGLLHGVERQAPADEVDEDHHEHRQHRLPLHHRLVVQRCPAVAAGIHAGHHAGRARGKGEARQRAVAVDLGIVAHGVLHGGHAGLDQTGLGHARLHLLGRDQVGLDRHWK